MNKFIKCLLAVFLIMACCEVNDYVFADEYIVNITVIGNVRSGKSTLVHQLTGDFTGGAIYSIGPCWVNNSAEGREVQRMIGDKTFKFRFWDAPGFMEEAKDLVDKIESIALKRSDYVIIVNDLSSENVQSSAPNTIAETFQYHGYASQVCDKTCKIIVVGSHADVASKEKCDMFKSKLDNMCSLIGAPPIPCFTFVAVNKDDPGCRQVMEYLVKSVAASDLDQFEKRELSGIVVTCCVCGKSYDKSECVPNTREGGYYCPEHKIENFRKKCPGSCSEDEHYFYDVERTVKKPDGTEEKCHNYVIMSDGKGRETKYCTQACMESALRGPCPREGCVGFLRCEFEKKGPNEFEKKGLVGFKGADGKFYCSEICRDFANRRPCACDGCVCFIYDIEKSFEDADGKLYCSTACREKCLSKPSPCVDCFSKSEVTGQPSSKCERSPQLLPRPLPRTLPSRSLSSVPLPMISADSKVTGQPSSKCERSPQLLPRPLPRPLPSRSLPSASLPMQGSVVSDDEVIELVEDSKDCVSNNEGMSWKNAERRARARSSFSTTRSMMTTVTCPECRKKFSRDDGVTSENGVLYCSETCISKSKVTGRPKCEISSSSSSPGLLSESDICGDSAVKVSEDCESGSGHSESSSPSPELIQRLWIRGLQDLFTPRCSECGVKLSHVGAGTVKENGITFCSRDCALKLVGMTCARGEKCTRDPSKKYLPSEMLHGNKNRTKDKLYCCDRCSKDG